MNYQQTIGITSSTTISLSKTPTNSSQNVQQGLAHKLFYIHCTGCLAQVCQTSGCYYYVRHFE